MNENPAAMDREERERVESLRRAAAKRPHLRISDERITRTNRKRVVTINPGSLQLGYSNSAALGDAMRAEIVKREEIKAQHGPVKVIMKNGVLL
jgi:hypothetical protein